MMRLGQAYYVLVYMDMSIYMVYIDLKCPNYYDETEQAGPHTIMHVWKKSSFQQNSKGCLLQISPFSTQLLNPPTPHIMIYFICYSQLTRNVLRKFWKGFPQRQVMTVAHSFKVIC